jgi:hypothetical protein
MKGGKEAPPNHNSRFFRSRTSSRRSQSSSRQSHVSSVQSDTLTDIGFDDSEIELLLDNEYFPGLTEEEIIEKYLEIAQNDPFNLNWDSVEDAINSDYFLGVHNSNGSEFTKHDIAKDVFNYFSHEQDSQSRSMSQGLAQGIRKKKKRTKKHRSHKRRHSRKTRHRRRH